jgi:CTP synthase (UTP-ammonia lyase)
MDLPVDAPAYRSTMDALDQAIAALDARVSVVVHRTNEIGVLGHAVVIGPGSPYRDAAAAESVIELARARGLPLVGT